MNIKEFLVENYIYIIIVIILAIITIIGFLADKKKNGDKRPNTMGGNIAPGGGQNMGNTPYPQPVNYQPINNMPNNGQMAYGNNPMPNMGMNLPNQPINNMTPSQPPLNNNPGFQGPQMMNMPQTPDMSYNVPQPVDPMQQNMNNVMQPVEQFNQNMNNNMMPSVDPMNQNVGSIPQPIEPMQQNVSQDLSYQPLSEQKPTFAPVEPNLNVMNNGGMDNNYQQPVMEPTNPVPNTMAPMTGPMPVAGPADPMQNAAGATMPNNTAPATGQPVSFVYGQGGQNNNNPYM